MATATQEVPLMSNAINVTESAAIRWVIERMTKSVMDEGYIIYEFKGNVPARMIAQVEGFLKTNGARYVDGRKESGYDCLIAQEGYYAKTFSYRRGSRIVVTIGETWMTEADRAEEIANGEYKPEMYEAQERYRDMLAAL
jgi:hypothetical protein